MATCPDCGKAMLTELPHSHPWHWGPPQPEVEEPVRRKIVLQCSICSAPWTNGHVCDKPAQPTFATAAYDRLTDDEMVELTENPMLVHLYDAHRLVAALVRGREMEKAIRRMAASGATGDQGEEETDFWFAVNDALAALGTEEGE